MAGNGQAPIAQLTANVRRTRMQRLLLPTTVVQESLEAASPEGRVLRLRVVCQACGPDTKLVLGPQPPVSSGKQRRRQRRRKSYEQEGGSGKNRTPYLVIQAKARMVPTPPVGTSRGGSSNGRSLRRRVSSS
jgi:hypothetical protein